MSDELLTSLLRELRRQNALLRVVHHEALERERAALLADPDFNAILKRTQKPIGATELKKAIQRATGHSSATVERRLTDLVERGLLERSGGGPQTKYEATGLIVP